MTEIRPAEPWRRAWAIAEFAAVAVCTIAFAATALSILAAMLGPNSAGTHDFVEYWASGQLLAHRANPYDAAALRGLERSAGFPVSAPTLIMGNPPSALLLVVPLGFVAPVAGEWLWLLAQLACLVASVQTIRKLLGSPGTLTHLLAYAFAPALSCLVAGQIAVFLLLGLVLFLRWHRSRPFWAGAALWLCLLKPHLFLPFGVALLLWIAVHRKYRILAGAALALGASTALALAIDPQVWSQYRAMMAEQRIDRIGLPCLSTALRDIVYPHSFWVQCLPAAAGCAWAVVYFWPRRAVWDWARHGALLSLVAVLVAPYSWFMDETVLIPALLAGAYATGSRALLATLALISAALQMAALRGTTLYSPLYLWTAPVWIAWFLAATRYKPYRADAAGPERALEF